MTATSEARIKFSPFMAGFSDRLKSRVHSPILYDRYMLLCSDRVAIDETSSRQDVLQVLSEDKPEIQSVFPIAEESLARRFQNGDLCFMLGTNQAMLSMVWGHRGKCYIRGAGKHLNIGDDTVYLYNAFTVPNVRRNRVFSRLINEFFKYYSGKGIKRYCSLVSPGNRQMLAILHENGFRVESNLRYIRIATFGILREQSVQGIKKCNYRISREPKTGYII
ncbi:MAG: hypothetical protein EHM45_02095 [Desulfobacteraceae bacterium]|nr:MAG: hypothetical protein EHM45_02095 [Desulfobacteraceae bacterium]